MQSTSLRLVQATCLSDEAFDNTVADKVGGLRNEFMMLIDNAEGVVPPEKTAKIEEMITAFQEHLIAGKDGLVASIAAIYDKEFTEEEQKAILEMYDSPTWKMFSAKAEVLQNQVIEAQSRWMQGGHNTLRDGVCELFGIQIENGETIATEPAKTTE